MSLLQMSFSGAVLILAIIVVRAVSINRLPKRTFLALWGIALLRLLLPFSIPSVFSAYSFLNHCASQLISDGSVSTSVLAPYVPVAGEAVPKLCNHWSSIPLSKIIWCIGLALCVIFFAAAYLRCRWEFQTSLPVKSDFVSKWLKEHRLKRMVTVRQLSRISSPLTYGIFHPVIIMPESTNWQDFKSLQYILTHEYVHIRRFDVIAKLILTAALSIHWFNPLVWVMYILANRDIELACDECVIREFGDYERSAYAMVLIRMEERKSGFTPLCNSFCKNAIEERITAIMRTKKTTVFSLILAALLVAGTAAAFATSAQADNCNQFFEEQDRVLNTAPNADGEILHSYVNSEEGMDFPTLHLYVKLENGEEQAFGPYATVTELMSDVRSFCKEQVKLGNMEQREADEIVNNSDTISFCSFIP